MSVLTLLVLHQWQLCIMKYAVTFTWALVKFCSARKRGRSFTPFCAELDRRVSELDGVRHADTSLPKKHLGRACLSFRVCAC